MVIHLKPFSKFKWLIISVSFLIKENVDVNVFDK